MKDVNTLVQDIYTMLETKEFPDEVNTEEICAEFGNVCADILREQLVDQDSVGRLRLSAFGKPDRQLYNAYHGVAGEPLTGPTYVKFIYGHITEAVVLALTELAGHKVTDRQKKVNVEGINGSIDGYIDGVLMDVKSCSSFGFKKFRNNTLHKDDPFGYIAQLRAYAHAERQHTYGWLAMDKSTGHLAWLQYDETKDNTPYKDAITWDVPERAKHLKKLVAGPLPSLCFDPVPDGKSGNMQLASGCRFCAFKHTCFPDMRVYRYSNGPRYLTTVVREPNVLGGLPDGF
jgi:hypothetical protein